MKDITFIYVYYNTPLELEKSIQSIEKSIGGYSYEIIVVDNNSEKKILEKSLLKIHLIKNKLNKGFGGGVNQGAKHAKGKYLVIINPDTVFYKNSVKKMIDMLEQDKKIGIIGPSMIDNEGKSLLTISGVPKLPDMLFTFSFLNKLFPKNKYSKKYRLDNINKTKIQEVDVLGGACLVLRKKVFDKVGGFDKQFFMYFEESDICMRLKKEGYKIIFFPESKIMHHVGMSNRNNFKIEKYFNKSRYQFIKKYYGFIPAVLSEIFLRTTTKNYFLLILVICVSLFLNLYRVGELTLFIGDQGRDFLVARNALLNMSIPLVGIPSSISWLHQGPLSIYLIILAMAVGGISVTPPAVLFGILGAVSTFLVYKFTAETFESSSKGLYAALFFATSPLQIINSRMPYHTSPIPFFAVIFFWLLYLAFKNPGKYIFFLLLSFGLILQVELSNAVLVVPLVVLWWRIRGMLDVKKYIRGLTGLVIGIFPFLLYDFSNRFIQTGGFALWIINRVRLFLGLASSDERTIHQLPQALERISQQLTGIVFPESIFIFLVFSILALIGFFYYFKENSKSGVGILLMWLFIPLAGFLVHTAPGVAYFPLVFPVVAIIVGLGFFALEKKFKYISLLFILVCFANAFFIVKKNYYLTTNSGSNPLPPLSYNYGQAVSIQKEAIEKILIDSKDRQFAIKGGGYIEKIGTAVDNYKFLALSQGGNVQDNSSLVYRIYENAKDLKRKEKIIYTSRFVIVTKNEN